MIKTSLTFANEESFNFYVKYLALKQHFTTDGYDYHKYRGKIKASFDTFRTRNDVFFFHKLANKDDPENLLLANMVVKPNAFIREIVEQDGEDRYFEWKKKTDSLSKVFKEDLNKLEDDYQQNFVSNNGQHPHVMGLYVQRKITLESFTILTNLSNIFPYWDKEIVDKIVARDIIRLSKKYRPFLNIDEKKFKSIIRERFF
jgi:T4 gene Gp59 loader of gp41 DNA helicase